MRRKPENCSVKTGMNRGAHTNHVHLGPSRGSLSNVHKPDGVLSRTYHRTMPYRSTPGFALNRQTERWFPSGFFIRPDRDLHWTYSSVTSGS